MIREVDNSDLNEDFLEERLAVLEKARDWSPRVISKLEALIRVPDDFLLFRVNPIQFSKEKGVSEQESIDLFLHATKLGLFKMEWQVLCPSCGDTVESFGALSSVHPDYFCNLCHLESQARLDDYIQISFTISPQIREIRYHYPENLNVEDFYFKYHFNQTARFPGGPTFLEAGAQLCKGVSYLAPGESKDMEVDAPEGFFIVHDLICNAGFMLPLKGGPQADPQTVLVRLKDGKFEVAPNEAAPGRIVFQVENQMSTKESILILLMPPDKQTILLEFEPFLSGNKLLTSQTFRTLFRSETVEGNEGIGVRDLTLLFTDLKGSTAMYERIGDLKAFSLVQQHFDRLGKAIQGNHGAIVKTIGDAVMASFEKPVDAVRASLQMLKEIEAFNEEHGGKEIILKVGIHRGASIAVTLNERLDYFGQTVNIAARVQGLADAEEIYITEEVFKSAGVGELLKEFTVTPETANLKGIQKTMKVVRITHPGSVLRKAAAHPPVEAGQGRPRFNIGKALVFAAAALVLLGGSFYGLIYLPDQEAKQRQIQAEKLKEEKRQQEAQLAAHRAVVPALPACPLILPLTDKYVDVTPLGSYLSYLAMKRASNLPLPAFQTPNLWDVFNNEKLFAAKLREVPKFYRKDLAPFFPTPDRGEGQYLKVRGGTKITLRFWGSRKEKIYSKTFRKKKLHLAPEWMASCLHNWMGFSPNLEQSVYLSKPLFTSDEDLKRGPRVEAALHATEVLAKTN